MPRARPQIVEDNDHERLLEAEARQFEIAGAPDAAAVRSRDLLQGLTEAANGELLALHTA